MTRSPQDQAYFDFSTGMACRLGSKVVECCDNLLASLDHTTLIHLPHIVNTGKQLGKCGALRSSTPVWRKVGATKKGFTVWGEPNVERSTSTTGQLLDEVHVDIVDVGTLFAVDFDTNEMLIEIGGYFGGVENDSRFIT